MKYLARVIAKSTVRQASIMALRNDEHGNPYQPSRLMCSEPRNCAWKSFGSRERFILRARVPFSWLAFIFARASELIAFESIGTSPRMRIFAFWNFGGLI